MHVFRPSFVRNTILATVLLAGVYALRAAVPLPPPLISFHPLRMSTILGLRISGSVYPVVFIGELFALGVVSTAAAHLVHRLTSNTHHADWHLGVASALSVVGIHWIQSALTLYTATHVDRGPVVITGILGLILLGLAGLLAGSFASSGAQT